MTKRWFLAWIFFVFIVQACGAVQCKRAQVGIWQDINEGEYKYKVTVRCHNDDGHQDINVVKSKTKIVGCKEVLNGN